MMGRGSSELSFSKNNALKRMNNLEKDPSDQEVFKNPLAKNLTSEQVNALNGLTSVFISKYGFSGGWDDIRKRSDKKEVDISKIGTLQPEVGKPGLEHYIDEISQKGPSVLDSVLVYRVGGKDYVADGNHRIVAARLMGIKKSILLCF